MRDVYEKYGIVLDPHGAVGWKSLEIYRAAGATGRAVIYETADPGKFPEDVAKATGVIPEPPPRMKLQESLEERTYRITEAPLQTPGGRAVSPGQISRGEGKDSGHLQWRRKMP